MLQKLVLAIAMIILPGCSGLRHLEMDSLMHTHASPTQNIYFDMGQLRTEMNKKDKKIRDINNDLEKKIKSFHRNAEKKSIKGTPEAYEEMKSIHKEEEKLMHELHKNIEKHLEKRNDEIIDILLKMHNDHMKLHERMIEDNN